MSRASEAARKAYPVQGEWVGNQYGEWDCDKNQELRKAFLQGYEQADENIIALIESRIGEILGDAQPAPVLRAELRGLIKIIKEK